MKLLKEFWPAIKFVLTFVATYFFANVFYGIYIENTRPQPDVFTRAAAAQTGWVLKTLRQPVTTIKNPNGPTVFVQRQNQPILSVYEGCNGVNVAIVFVSFILAFAGAVKYKLSFLAFGMVVINLANVVRLTLLYFVATRYQTYFYFIHKYIFTLILYVIVMLLWWVYVNRLNGKQKEKRHAA